MDEVLLPMQQELAVLLTAVWTSQILNDRVNQGMDVHQSAQEEGVVVEVCGEHAGKANLDEMCCCGAIFGSVCSANRDKNKNGCLRPDSQIPQLKIWSLYL